MDPVSVAYLIKKGKLRPEEVSYRQNLNVKYDANGDGVKGDDEKQSKLYSAGTLPEVITGNAFAGYSYYRYDAADYVKEVSGKDAGFGFDDGFGTTDIPNSLFPKYYSETYRYEDFLNKWVDWEYNKELPALVTDLAAPATVYVEDMPMTCTSDVAETGAVKGTTAIYTGEVKTFASQVEIIDFLGDSVATDRQGLTLDENGAYKQKGNGGTLIKYPDGFGLEDAVYIGYSFGVINDSSFRYGNIGYWNGEGEGKHKPSFHDVWINPKVSYPWYSFKVNRDAEVIVFTTSDIAFLSEAGYDKVTLANADIISTSRNMNSGYKYDFTRVYSKKFSAGDTVEMKTAMGDKLYMVFVKEANATTADTSLSSISVNGVPVEGFDPAVKEYNVEITDPSVLTAPVVTATANDANARVYVEKATSFPGITTIQVVHANGVTDEYKVNHTYSGDLVSNVQMLDGSGIIPYEYIAYATEVDKTTGETVPKFTKDYKMITADKITYLKNGMVVGSIAFTGRDTTITQINDASLIGKDVIIPGMEWYNGGACSYAFQGSGRDGGVHIDNWVNFNLNRKATIKIMMASPSAVFEKILLAQGYTKSTSNVNYFESSTISRNRKAMFTKTFDAGLVNIPNGNIYNNDAYTIVIDYVDYE